MGITGNSTPSTGSLKHLYKDAHSRRYDKGQIVIHEGDSVKEFFFIKRGFVKVYTLTEDGEEKTLLILKPQDIFPLLKDPDQTTHVSLYFYEPMSTTDVGIMTQDELMQQIKEDRQAAWSLLRYVSEFSNTLTERLSQLESKKAEDKVENLLPYLIGVCGKEIRPNNYLLDLRITRQDIATLVGLTRETATIEIKKLAKKGILSFHGSYLVVNTENITLPT